MSFKLSPHSSLNSHLLASCAFSVNKNLVLVQSLGGVGSEEAGEIAEQGPQSPGSPPKQTGNWKGDGRGTQVGPDQVWDSVVHLERPGHTCLLRPLLWQHRDAHACGCSLGALPPWPLPAAGLPCAAISPRPRAAGAPCSSVQLESGTRLANNVKPGSSLVFCGARCGCKCCWAEHSDL